MQALTLRRLSNAGFNILLYFNTSNRHVLQNEHCDSRIAEDSDLQDGTQCRGVTFRWFVLSSSSNVKQSKSSSTLEYKRTPMFRKAGNYARYDAGSPFLHPMLQQC